MRVPLVAGNWKMHKTVGEAVSLARDVAHRVRDLEGIEVAVAPPFTALSAVGEALRGSPVRLGAQDVYWEELGAFTGEISVPMLRDLGVRYAIVGHSERRQLFGETDQVVRHKAGACIQGGLVPIVCVGETLAERERGEALAVVQRQVRESLTSLGEALWVRAVVAYEPVWAIGTGRTAGADQAQEMHAQIRRVLADEGGQRAAEQVRILYGGSVKPDNATGLLAGPDVDGALVGGASLDPASFASIARFRV